jgi:acyl-CoA reductase-like NAD-dependent aldehyde dehydrogenase
MVIKPGEQAPPTVMRIVAIVSEVLPDDVLHVMPAVDAHMSSRGVFGGVLAI